MISAYILIQTDVRSEAEVARDLASIPGIDVADTTLGPYEVIVHATGRNLDEFAVRPLRQIQQTKGVSRTLTCPVVQAA